MDGSDVTGFLLLGLLLAAGLASFAVAGLVGGAVASVAVRRPAGGLGWFLVAMAGTVAGPLALVGAILLWGILEPSVGQVPLLYPTWVLTAVAGAATRVGVSSRLVATG